MPHPSSLLRPPIALISPISLIALISLTALAMLTPACGSVTSDNPDDDPPDGGADAAPTDAGTDAAASGNLISNGDFGGGTLHWTAVDTSMSVVDGALELRQLEPQGPGLAWQMIPNVSGGRLRFSADFIAGSFPTGIQVRLGNAINDNSLGVLTANASEIEVEVGPKKVQLWITVNNVATSSGQYGLFDNIALISIASE